MVFLADDRYDVRFPEDLCLIDPDFIRHWMLPCFQADGSFVLPADADLSPLAAYVPTGLDTLEQLHSEVFRTGDLRPELEQILPLTAEEEASLFPKIARQDPQAINRMLEGYLHDIFSLASSYCPHKADYVNAVCQGRQGLDCAMSSYIPGSFGGFRGYALWHIRIAIICYIWDSSSKNPHRYTGKICPEYRLRDRDNPICTPPEQPNPHIAVSPTPLACLYRKLKQQDPSDFQGYLERMTSRELEVLDLLMQENCMLTIYDAADLFSVPVQRIEHVIRKLYRQFRPHRPRGDGTRGTRNLSDFLSS